MMKDLKIIETEKGIKVSFTGEFNKEHALKVLSEKFGKEWFFILGTVLKDTFYCKKVPFKNNPEIDCYVSFRESEGKIIGFYKGENDEKPRPVFPSEGMIKNFDKLRTDPIYYRCKVKKNDSKNIYIAVSVEKIIPDLKILDSGIALLSVQWNKKIYEYDILRHNSYGKMIEKINSLYIEEKTKEYFLTEIEERRTKIIDEREFDKLCNFKLSDMVVEKKKNNKNNKKDVKQPVEQKKK